MCILNHPNILPCIGAHCFGPKYLLITPFKANGSLQSVLMDKSLKIGWKRRVMMALDIASALAYMHRYKVVHRDVKSANIVVDPDWHVFVTDFGTARVIGKHDKRDREKLIGTAEWMAPEMFTEVKKDYTEKVDVYSFAIVLYEIITRAHPYNSQAVKGWQIPELVVAGERPALPAGFTCPVPPLVDLMKACWNQNMKKRPPLTRVVELLAKLVECTEDDTVTKVDWMNPEKRSVDSTNGMIEALTDLDDSMSLHDVLAMGSAKDRAKRTSQEGPRITLGQCRSDSSGSSRHSMPSTPPELMVPSTIDMDAFLPGVDAVKAHESSGSTAWPETPENDQCSQFAAALMSELTHLKTVANNEISVTQPPVKMAHLERTASLQGVMSPRARLAAAATASMKTQEAANPATSEKGNENLEKKLLTKVLLFSRSKSNKTMHTDEIKHDDVDPEPVAPPMIAPPGTVTPRTDLFSTAGYDIF